MAQGEVCDKCQHVLDNWNNQYYASSRRFHNKMCALEASAEEGCLLCAVILTCYTKVDLERVRTEHSGDSVLISVRPVPYSAPEFPDCYSLNTWVGNFSSETCVYATPAMSIGKPITTYVFPYFT